MMERSEPFKINFLNEHPATSRIDIIGQNGNDGLHYSAAGEKEDPGAHYRYHYRVKLTKQDIDKGFVDIQLDPFRIAQIYKMQCQVLFTMLKKVLRAGTGGHKDLQQDLRDINNAVTRKQQMMEEDDHNQFTF